jgi:hypothetical protein
VTTRIELDFRHQLAELRITQGPEGPSLSLTHGDSIVVVNLSHASLSALWLATIKALTAPLEATG